MSGKLCSVEFQHSLILQAWQCLIGDGSVAYVSGPITTGLRWIRALEAGTDAGRPVIEANCETIRVAARQLRSQTAEPVLEPASLHVDGWSQEDYLTLWMTLIERHASRVAFVEGWSYSIGCSLEFERAVAHNIATQTLDGQPICRQGGASLIRQAAADLIDRSMSVPKAVALAERLSLVASRLSPAKGL